MTDKIVLGVGAALVDLLIEESDDFIKSLNSQKGGMTLVESDRIQEIVNKSACKPTMVPGGSACNTLVGMGYLGGKARFIGRYGKDELADVFQRGLKKAGVENVISESDTATGRVLSVITPDAQRTMFTCLGASLELSVSDVLDNCFENVGIVYLEGYLLYNRAVVQKLIENTKSHGAKLCIDLGAFQVVEENKQFLEEIIESSVDIIIANEDEAKAYTGKNEDESLDYFSKLVDIAVVKKGKKGAIIAQGDQKVSVPAVGDQVLDTTGAGDLWAAGFVYGLIHNYSLEKAGKLGSEIASEVIRVVGACIPQDGWDRIKTVKSEIESS